MGAGCPVRDRGVNQTNLVRAVPAHEQETVQILGHQAAIAVQRPPVAVRAAVGGLTSLLTLLLPCWDLVLRSRYGHALAPSAACYRFPIIRLRFPIVNLGPAAICILAGEDYPNLYQSQIGASASLENQLHTE